MATGDSAGIRLTDDDLMSLDFAPLRGYEVADARNRLRTFGDIFRFQLIAALDLEQRADALERLEDVPSMFQPEPNPERFQGYVAALRDVAAWLRTGEFLPGGDSFENVAEVPSED